MIKHNCVINILYHFRIHLLTWQLCWGWNINSDVLRSSSRTKSFSSQSVNKNLFEIESKQQHISCFLTCKFINWEIFLEDGISNDDVLLDVESESKSFSSPLDSALFRWLRRNYWCSKIHINFHDFRSSFVSRALRRNIITYSLT